MHLTFGERCGKRSERSRWSNPVSSDGRMVPSIAVTKEDDQMLRELVEVARLAGADAALAERVYTDGEFRAELRTQTAVALGLFVLGARSADAPEREILAA
jgi:hypothetical protein